MREVCFCGWAGEVEDRRPIYGGDGEWGLVCPDCGRLDRLHYLREEARRRTLAEAARRQGARQAGSLTEPRAAPVSLGAVAGVARP